MPELPEVETIRRSLAPLAAGRIVTRVELRSHGLRRPFPDDLVSSLTDRPLGAWTRRGKYLLVEIGDNVDDPRVLLCHMGMSGQLRFFGPEEAAEAGRHDHVELGLDDGSRLVFRDPRRFGLFLLEDPLTSSWLVRLGPEPRRDAGFTGAYLANRKRSTRRAIKDVLMDQQVVAGLGNIYVNEILYAAGLRPRRSIRRLTAADCERVAEATESIIEEAIEHRGTTVSDFLDGIGQKGGYQWRRRVYGREGEPCARCKTTIKRIVVGARSSFYCPACQR